MRAVVVATASGAAAVIGVLPPIFVAAVMLGVVVVVSYVAVMSVTAKTQARRHSALETLRTIVRWRP